MFRNTYLELYKNTNKQDLHTLFLHFSHIYATMGSVIQDLEIQIFKPIANQDLKQPQSIFKEFAKKKIQIEPIKIEDTFRQPIPFQQAFHPKQDQIKSIIGSSTKQNQSTNHFINTKPKEQPQNAFQANIQTKEKYRNPQSFISASSFDQLFQRRIDSKPDGLQSNHQPQAVTKFSKANLQNKTENEEFSPDHSADLLDYIFQKSEDIKRKR